MDHPTLGRTLNVPAHRAWTVGANPRTRTGLLIGTLVLAAWILAADLQSGSLEPWGPLIGVAATVLAAVAIRWQLAWLGVGALFVVSAVVPWETSGAGFVLIIVAVFDTCSHLPAWRGLALLGCGLTSLLLDWGLGVQDLAATIAFSFVLIAVATVGSLVRAQAERVGNLEELARLRRQLERTGLARDMHDIVATPMSHVVLIAADLLSREDVPSALRAPLRLMQSQARESLEELRAMLAYLRSEDAVTGSAPATADAVTREWQASIERLSSRGFTPDAHLDIALPAGQTQRAEVLLLAVRELTTNVLRHSTPPGLVRMTLTASSREASVLIANPVTEPPRGLLPASGLGLLGLRERAEQCGGQLITTRMDGEWLAMVNFDSELPAA
ncbi:MAG: sensor histidine kinase [Propionicimonas sp.]